jgi:hypothetical protein
VGESSDLRDSGPGEGGGEGGGEAVVLRLGDEELVLRERFELMAIANEIGIAVFFTVGSVAFYWHSLFTLGVTLFVMGSIQLGIRPAIRFVHRVKLRKLTAGTAQRVARDF